VRTGSVIEPTVRHERILDEARGVGYLALSSFTHETATEFDAAFERLRQDGMRALVLDLRGNPGGVLMAAVEIARRFVREGLIVSTEGRDESVTYEADPAAAWHAELPLVVIVDEGSASASEVLAAALKEHRAAVIVGMPTYGKGMVQTIRNFDRWKTRAKVTSSFYYSPSHRNFEHSADPDRDFGILPDLSIPVTRAEQRAVHEFVAVYGPPLASIPSIEAWEEQAGEVLLARIPDDPQLEAALALFAGERPGPHRLVEAE
jgi:carboxyl-terminal processing protease